MTDDWLAVQIYEPARKEIGTWPIEARKDLGSILTKLQKGDFVGFPDVDSMRTVGSGCFEIRVRCQSGIFRAFYIAKSAIGILVFHAFCKKTQKTPVFEIEIGRQRLYRFMKEIENE